MEYQESKPGRGGPAAHETHGYYPDNQAPPYTYSAPHTQERTAWYSPKTWSRKVWIAVIVVVVIIIVIAIAVPVAVTQTQNNSYPDYAEVAYSLAETCKRETNYSHQNEKWPNADSM